MDELKTLESMGFTLPTPAYIRCRTIRTHWLCRLSIRQESLLQTAKWIGIALDALPLCHLGTWLLPGGHRLVRRVVHRASVKPALITAKEREC